MKDVYEYLNLPENAYLDRRIYKKHFLENGLLSTADKRYLSEDVEGIQWKYTLKPSTIPVASYTDADCEYLEIAIIEIQLSKQGHLSRLHEVIQRTIPYPVFSVFAYQDVISVGLAMKRYSKAEKGAIVADDMRMSDWISLKQPESTQQKFLNNLAISQLQQTNFKALYEAWMERLIALKSAVLSGTFRVLSNPERIEKRHQLLRDCHELEVSIQSLKTQLKKEVQFNRQVELNTRIKQLEKKLSQTIEQL